MPPEEAMAAARARATKLQLMLDTLGEEDEMYPTIKAAFLKAHAQAQERPASEQIKNTQSFLVRNQKRVEQTRADTAKAREALAQALAMRRLEELLAKEQAVPSPFSVHVPPVGPDVQAEFSRMQETIDKLQQQLAKLRSGPAQLLPPTVSDDDEDECRRKKPRAGPTTPLAITGRAAPTTPLAITGGHAQSPMIGVSSCS